MVRPELSPKTAVPRGVTIHICLFYAVSDTEFLYFYAFGNTGDSSMQISELLYFNNFFNYYFYFIFFLICQIFIKGVPSVTGVPIFSFYLIYSVLLEHKPIEIFEKRVGTPLGTPSTCHK